MAPTEDDGDRRAGAKSLVLSLRNIYATLGISVPTVFDAMRGRITKEVCDARLAVWGHRIVENAGLHLDVRGRENMKPGETYLVMSNHQSHYDIPVMFEVIGPNIRMITKEELFRVPIFGNALRRGRLHLHRSARSPRRHPQPGARAGPRGQRDARVDRPGGDAKPHRRTPAVQEGRLLPGARGGALHPAGDAAGNARRASGQGTALPRRRPRERHHRIRRSTPRSTPGKARRDATR